MGHALLAGLLMLASTAWAGIGDGRVYRITTTSIADGAVTTAKLGDGAVTTSKINADAVTVTGIIDGAVTTPKLATDAVTNAKVINAAITTGKLANGAVTTSKLGVDLAFTGSANFDAGTLYVDPANNRVGVGTTAPAEDLHISAAGDYQLRIAAPTAGGEKAGLTIYPGINDANARNWAIGTEQNGRGLLEFIVSASSTAAPATYVLTMDRTGNVGIGTTSPSTLLDVAGQAGLFSRTRAQIDTLTPGKAGAVIFCSNCATNGDICVSTGTAAAQWRRIGTAAGCGSGE